MYLYQPTLTLMLSLIVSTNKYIVVKASSQFLGHVQQQSWLGCKWTNVEREVEIRSIRECKPAT